jgi:hypothetical protein
MASGSAVGSGVGPMLSEHRPALFPLPLTHVRCAVPFVHESLDACRLALAFPLERDEAPLLPSAAPDSLRASAVGRAAEIDLPIGSGSRTRCAPRRGQAYSTRIVSITVSMALFTHSLSGWRRMT